MRPLSLRLIGFRSYSDETIDFRHHGLVVISGDTGAGKTSILDGISFALFGRTPELSTSRELLTLGATHGEVALTFAAGASQWRVTRRFGRDAPEPGHQLEQLDGNEVVDRVIGATAVNAAVTALIGLTFQSFTSAVLLAQGRFAQFLQSTPKDRDAILRELFSITGLDAVRTQAIATRDAHLATADALDDERRRRGEITQSERTARARALRIATATQATLLGLHPTVTALEQTERLADEASDRAEQIRRSLAEVGDADEHERIVVEHTRILRSLAEARTRRDDAHRALEEAALAGEELRRTHGGTATELGALRAHAERSMAAAAALPTARQEFERRVSDLRARRTRLDADRGRLGVLATARETRQAIADALTRVVSTRAIVAESSTALAAARAARDDARGEAARAAEDSATADAAMDELRHAHATDHLRGELRLGSACPVCGQTVYELPDVPVDDLDTVEAGVASLRTRAEAAAAAQAAAEANLRSIELHDATARTAAADALAMLRAVGGSVDDDQATLDALRAELADLEHEHARLAPVVAGLATEVEREAGSIEEAERRLERDRAEVAELSSRLGEWAAHDSPVAALTAAVRQLETIEQTVQQSTRAFSQAVDHVAQAEDELRTFEQQRLGAIRQSLAVLATRLGASVPAPELHPAELIDAVESLAAFGAEQAAEADRLAAEAGRRIEALNSQIAAVGGPLGLQRGDELSPRLRTAGAAVRSAEDALATIEHAARERMRLAARSESERRLADIYGQVAIDLQANRFPRFLLSRFHERLAVGATSRLLALSHGAFSFTGTEPDHLAVVDHRRDHRVRSAATLSGGERFLASLSLALALSDIASGADGRLECLFLDEGFSALDADSLELAISGVEQMADDGRLVVIITHLPGVAERLGAAIHVRKDPGGQSRVIDLGGRQREEMPADAR